MAGFVSTVYRAVFRKTSTLALAVIVGAFFFERGCDVIADSIYDNINKGKQWKDIKHNYVQE